jgi:hypothetical protein
VKEGGCGAMSDEVERCRGGELPGDAQIIFYKNGVCQGTAFDNVKEGDIQT